MFISHHYISSLINDCYCSPYLNPYYFSMLAPQVAFSKINCRSIFEHTTNEHANFQQTMYADTCICSKMAPKHAIMSTCMCTNKL